MSESPETSQLRKIFPTDSKWVIMTLKINAEMRTKRSFKRVLKMMDDLAEKKSFFSLETSLFFTNFSISKLCCLKQSYSSNPSMTNWVLNSTGQQRTLPTSKIAIVRLMILQAKRTHSASSPIVCESVMMLSNQNSYISFSNTQKCTLRSRERVVNIPRRMKKVSYEILYCKRWCLISHPSLLSSPPSPVAWDV